MALRVKRSPHSRAFRELAAVLRSDPALAACVRTWVDWSGDVRKDTRELAVALCPAVSLVPGAGADAWEGPQGMAGRLVVAVGVAVGGTNADDLLDLYHAIRTAIYPEDLAARQAIRSRLEAAGALDDPEFTQGNFGVGLTDEGPMLVGVGQVTIQVRTLA